MSWLSRHGSPASPEESVIYESRVNTFRRGNSSLATERLIFGSEWKVIPGRLTITDRRVYFVRSGISSTFSSKTQSIDRDAITEVEVLMERTEPPKGLRSVLEPQFKIDYNNSSIYLTVPNPRELLNALGSGRD